MIKELSDFFESLIALNLLYLLHCCLISQKPKELINMILIEITKLFLNFNCPVLKIQI